MCPEGFWSLEIYSFFGKTKFEHLERQEDVYFTQIPSNKFISAIQIDVCCMDKRNRDIEALLPL